MVHQQAVTQHTVPIFSVSPNANMDHPPRLPQFDFVAGGNGQQQPLNSHRRSHLNYQYEPLGPPGRDEREAFIQRLDQFLDSYDLFALPSDNHRANVNPQRSHSRHSSAPVSTRIESTRTQESSRPSTNASTGTTGVDQVQRRLEELNIGRGYDANAEGPHYPYQNLIDQYGSAAAAMRAHILAHRTTQAARAPPPISVPTIIVTPPQEQDECRQSDNDEPVRQLLEAEAQSNQLEPGPIREDVDMG
jgi:hypothetical protein